MDALHSVVHFSEWGEGGGAANAATRIHWALSNYRECKSQLLVFEGIDSPRKKLTVVRSTPRWSSLRSLNKLLVHIRHYIPERWRRLFDYLTVRDQGLQSAIGAIKPDFVFLHWVRPRRIGIRDIRRMPGTKVLILHDLRLVSGLDHYPSRGWTNEETPSFRLHERLVGVLIRKLLPADVQIVAPSRWVAEQAIALGWSAHRVHRIPYPVDLRLYSVRDREESLSGPRKIRIGFGFSGTHASFRKGQDLLIDAINLLKSDLSFTPHLVEFCFFGDSEAPAISDSRLAVTHLGNLCAEDLPDVFAALDFLVIPSRQENLALLAIEAQACGLPCVVMEGTGLTSAVPSNLQTMIAYPHPGAVYNALRNAIELIEHWPGWSSESRQHAERNFSASSVTARYKRLLESGFPK